MLHSSGQVVVKVVTVVPVILLVLYAGLLGLLGLLCGSERRKYVMDLSWQALETSSLLTHGPAILGSTQQGRMTRRTPVRDVRGTRR